MLTSLLLLNINANLRSIMTTQAEHAAQLNALTEKVSKVGTETRSLLTRIAELLEQLNAEDMISDEVATAMGALKAQVDVVDALVPDEEPAPEDPPL